MCVRACVRAFWFCFEFELFALYQRRVEICWLLTSSFDIFVTPSSVVRDVSHEAAAVTVVFSQLRSCVKVEVDVWAVHP